MSQLSNAAYLFRIIAQLAQDSNHLLLTFQNPHASSQFCYTTFRSEHWPLWSPPQLVSRSRHEDDQRPMPHFQGSDRM